MQYYHLLGFLGARHRFVLSLFYKRFKEEKKMFCFSNQFSKASGVYVHSIESLVSGLGAYWRWTRLLEYNEWIQGRLCRVRCAMIGQMVI